MVEAVAERRDADIGTIAGTSVAATAAGVGTFAAGSALANPESRAALQAAAGDKVINIGNSIKDFEGFKFAKEKAQEVASEVNTEEVKEAGKGIFGNIKDKAVEVGTWAKDNVQGFLGDAKENFGKLDKKTQAAVVIGTTLATLAVAKVAHDKMTEIDPQQAQIAEVSQGVQMGRSSQIQV